jgi:hypothetical protein
MYIEPCCYDKQLTELLKKIEGKGNVAHFFSNSDWDLTQLLPFLAYRTPGGEVTICLVYVENNVLDAIRRVLRATYVDTATKETKNYVSHLTLITQGENRSGVLAHLKGFKDRLSVCEDNIGFRCVTCSNGERSFVVQGSINQRVSSATQMYTITTGSYLYNQTMEVLASKRRVKTIKDWEQAYERVTNA